MKTVEVVAAIIRKNDRVFDTQRGYGPWKDFRGYTAVHSGKRSKKQLHSH